jgi:hypothetical protein
MISANIIRRAGVFTAAAVVAVALTGIAPAGASASTCTAWTGVQPPNPDPSFNELNGVAVLSACNAWAVGSYHAGMGTGGAQTLILHWNGAVWTQVASPDPGSAENILTGVAAVSATNIWAVGFTFNTGSSAEQTLILHWNGTVWQQVASPGPSSAGSFLQGVAATSASNAWAVGFSSDTDNGPDHTLTFHWNGTAWQRVKSPDPFGWSVLNGVAATSTRNAWAAGFSFPAGPDGGGSDPHRALERHGVAATGEPEPLLHQERPQRRGGHLRQQRLGGGLLQQRRRTADPRAALLLTGNADGQAPNACPDARR